MRKLTFAAIFLLGAALGTTAQAADVFNLKTFIAEKVAEQKTTAASIENLRNAYPAFCEDRAKVDVDFEACIAYYKMLVASAEKEAAVINAQFAAAKTSPKNLAALLKILPPNEFNDEGSITKRRSAEIGAFFNQLKLERLRSPQGGR